MHDYHTEAKSRTSDLGIEVQHQCLQAAEANLLIFGGRFVVLLHFMNGTV